MSTAPAPPEYPVDYRMAPAVVARFFGLGLVLLAVVMFFATFLVAAVDAPADLLVALLALGLVGIFVGGWFLRSRAYLFRATPHGYRVRMVRGAGVKEARWTSVEDAVTVVRHDVPCVMLRLKDGGTTTIPAGLLAVDKDRFVRELQQHLQRGHGLKRL